MRAGTSETELAFPVKCGKTPGHRPGSRLRLERRQTRSSNNRASVRVRAKKLVAFDVAGSSTALRAADELGVARFFWGKEFQFAYI